MERKVYLIGCGIAREHLTIEAVNAIKKSDVILYDRLIDKKILGLNNRAKKIYVGKRCGESLKQDKINRLFLRFKGKNIARLHSGDSFIFGRGFEESLFLESRGIKAEVIPGISAFQVLEKLGIPITYRKTSSSVALITGSKADGSNRYSGLCADTLIFYMAIINLPRIIKRLKDEKKHLKSDFVLIENAFRENCRIINGNINNILELAGEAKIDAPSLVVVGKVKRRLSSNRVVTFRQKENERETVNKLKDFNTINYPLFKIKYKKIKNEKLKINEKVYVFTSPNGVKSVFSQIKLEGRFVAIGDITKKEIEKHVNAKVEVPKLKSSSGLMSYLKKYSKKEVIVFCSPLTSVKGYKKVYCYEAQYAKKALRLNKIIEKTDVIFPTSSEIIRHLVKLVDKRIVNKKIVVVIGSEVAKTAKELGVHVDFMLEKPDISGLNALL